MRPVFLAAVGFATALFISEFIGAYALIPVGVCALFSLAFFLLRRKNPNSDRRLKITIAACAALVGALWHLLFTVFFYSPAVSLVGERGEYEAIVRDYPKHYDYGSSVEVELDGVGANARVRLWIGHHIDLEPGDRLIFDGKLDTPDSTPNFDFLSYYRSRRVFLDGEVTEVIAVEAANHTPLRFLPAVIRHSLGDKFAKLYSGDDLAMIRALCLGDRSSMSESLRFAVRAGGLSHLLAISGLHITLLCGALVAGFRNRRRSKLGASLFAMLAVLMFILVCGAPASAARAFVMHGFLLLAVAIRRDDDPLTALGASLLLLLVINPYAISDLGLQLSFLATLGILLHFGKARGLASTRFAKRVRSVLPPLLRKPFGALVDAVLLTLIANLYTAPIIAYTFGSLPLYGVLANIPALVLMPIVLVGGLLSGLLSFVALPAARAIAGFVSPFIGMLRGVAYFFARMPFALVDTSGAYNILALALGYALIIIWRATPGRKHGKLCASLAALAFALSLSLGEVQRRCDSLDASVLDVGQGQSILLTSNGRAALVDCGGDCYEGAGCQAAEALMLRGRRELDALILTHYHADHTNGIADLLRFVNVKQVYAPPPEEDEPVLGLLESQGAEITFVDTYDVELEFADATLTVCRPVQRSSENESGVAILASSGGFDLFMTGDLGSSSEKILLERYAPSAIEVIVAGHHGSKYSTSDEYLDRLYPQAALISVGYNTYGHPARDTLERLDAHGLDIYRTDLDGMLTVRVGKEAD